MLYGIDVSAYQPNFDFAAARREGYDFAFIKSTEGTGWRSAYYVAQVKQARASGFLVAAYHYVNGSDVAGQLANIRAMVSTDTPVILDVEAGAGGIGSIRALNSALNQAGYRTPLIYIPRWYWQGTMGSPDLTGLPPNWHSRYPDNVVRRKEGFALGAEYWPSFGGIHTEVAQFTSSLAVGNYPSGRIDGNAYRGTRAQLEALLNGDDGMQFTDRVKLVSPGDPDWSEEHPLNYAVENAFYKSSDAYKVLFGIDGVGGLLEEFAALKKENAALKDKVSKIESGAGGTYPGDDHVRSLAVDAVRDDLND